MAEDKFKDRFLIPEDSDELTPTTVYDLHTQRIFREASIDLNVKNLLEKLNEEQIKCFKSLENAIIYLAYR